jgi:proteasome beta subunit
VKTLENPVSTAGDFLELLQRSGYSLPSNNLEKTNKLDSSELIHGTTVLAFHFKDGVIVAGDRRATAGNSIMYEHCDKVIPIDDYSVMAIAGAPATAFEMARVLSHNFEYYRRSQLQPLSSEGKIRALSRLLKENVGMAMQGVGAVSPIFALYDQEKGKPSIHFYDLLGAEFQITTHTVTGSGSPMVKGVLEYEDMWGAKRLSERSREEAAELAMRLLHTAAHFDTATGKARPEDNIYPIISFISSEGYQFMDEKEIAVIFEKSMKRHINV